MSVFRLGSVCSKSPVPNCRHGEDAEGTGQECQVNVYTHALHLLFIKKITAVSLNALKVHIQGSFIKIYFKLGTKNNYLPTPDMWEIFALSPVGKVGTEQSTF